MTGDETRTSRDVALGWVRPNLVEGDFMDSVLATLVADGEGEPRIADCNRMVCSANISDGRNRLVEWFLDTTAEWLLMVDTDMVWEPVDVARLLEAAHPENAPIVGALCFAKERESGAIWPTLFELEPVDGDLRFFRYHSWPPNQLMPVCGTGAAFLLVHRKVYEKVRERKFSAAYPWFQESENAFGRISEDLTFCLRAQACGFPIQVHTGVQVGHVKQHTISARDYFAQRMGANGA